MRVLETKRLLLKPIEEKDLEFLLGLRWDANVTAYLMHEPISMEDQKKWFQNLNRQKNIVLSINLKDGQNEPKIIGTVGLYNINQKHQLAGWRIRIASDVQSKGIASEAGRMIIDYGFNTLNLHKIINDSFADNAAVLKMIERLGCVREGHLKAHYYHKGTFRDAYQYAIFKDVFNDVNKEWLENSNK